MTRWIADLRHGSSFPNNSASALAHARDQLGFKEVLLSCLVSPFPEDDPRFFFGPMWCDEFLELGTMAYTDWMGTVLMQYDISKPDSLGEILANSYDLEKLWIDFNIDSMEEHLPRFEEQLPDPRNVVCILPRFPRVKTQCKICSPVPHSDFLLTDGSLRSHAISRWKRQQTFTYQPNGLADYRLKIIP